MNGHKIRIKLKGFDYRVIDQSASDIVDTAKSIKKNNLILIINRVKKG